jgi:hypothetical protein
MDDNHLTSQMESKWLHFIYDEGTSNLNLSLLHPSDKPYLSKFKASRSVKLVRCLISLVGFKINCTNKLMTALLNGYKALGD